MYLYSCNKNLPRNNVDFSSNAIEEAYWRKANAIHSWFVKNVQGGIDDLGWYTVSKEQLISLLETVNQVIEDKSLAEQLLPPQFGFFFGSTDIDERYFDNLEYTKNQLEKLLETYDEQNEYFYTSSW